MGLQKYRADESDAPDANGAVAHYARWMGGPTLAKIVNCPVARGVMPPRTVFITAEPDTYFSQPAACTYRGRTVRGFVTHIDGQWRFNPDRDSFASRRLTVEITYDTVSEDSLVDGATSRARGEVRSAGRYDTRWTTSAASTATVSHGRARPTARQSVCACSASTTRATPPNCRLRTPCT